MALITCLDCKHQVSDVASACPNCGRPTDGASTILGRANGQHGAVKVVSLVLLIIGGLMFISQPGGLSVLGLWLGVSGFVCFLIALATDKRR